MTNGHDTPPARGAAEQLDTARRAVSEATAALEALRRHRAELARTIDPRDVAGSARLGDIDEEIERAVATLEDRRRDVADKRRSLGDVLADGPENDPVEHIGRLDARTPILLMPLRIETRFKGLELLVRVYPDDWAVDSFEEQLTQTEVDNGRRFWASTFRARGDEGIRRSAWRALVASHGSGRAGWIIDRHRPLNAEPPPGDPTDVVLVVITEADLDTAQTAALATYWEGIWRGGGHPDPALAADLRGAVGDALAETLLAQPPTTLRDERPGVDRETAVVVVALCRFEPIVPEDTRSAPWTAAPRAQVLPDRFVLLGLDAAGNELVHALGEPIPPSLDVGPDPAAGRDDQFALVDGDLVVPDGLRWMVDFDAALKVGMAFRIPLDRRTRRGFDRLFVVGLRVDSTAERDQVTLETLLTHHRRSRRGVSIVAQGTPTNNTEGNPAGHERLDDADATYDLYVGAGPALASLADWDVKQDGQWLAECLGIDPKTFSFVDGAAATDQAEARWMHTALWPATLGYFLGTMMDPVLDDDTVESVRSHLIDHVSGRGRLPALRIGRQPYGILPVSSLSQMHFGREDRFVAALQRTFGRVAKDWAPMADAVPHIHGSGDPHQRLLDVVALHPSSVEFHQRYAQSFEDLISRFSFEGFNADFVQVIDALGSIAAGQQLLSDLGFQGGTTPDILDKLFHGQQHRLQGPVVDDRPLSEVNEVRAYCDDGKNYLEWLAAAAQTSLDVLRRQEGFTDDVEPTALLYILLRHALLLSWWDTGVRLRYRHGLLDDDGLRATRREPSFVHVAGEESSESRWAVLYSPAPAITGHDLTLLAEMIPSLFGDDDTRHLEAVIEAIDRMRALPTARLERLLAEHLDLCSHRLDSWRLSLVAERLVELRGIRGDGAREPARGVHLGAYGWLEEVRPENKAPEAVQLPDDLAATFARESDPPLFRDATNGGYIHGPSLDHAATAAILRSGFLNNTSSAHPDVLALNISSERMRLAISVLQGLRNGQTIGALLGYRFERGLHDRHDLAEVDSFIHPLRKAFPSAGDRDGRLPIDGLALVRHIQETGARTYPYGRAGLPAAGTSQQQALDLETELLLDVHDAVADLVLAEAVHQSVLGNPDRVASTLDTASGEGIPTEPAVLQTPGRGLTITQRFGVGLRTGLMPSYSPVAGIDPTPRSMAEPAVNELVAALLPSPTQVRARVRWTDPDGTDRSLAVSWADLGLQPMDLLRLLHLEDQSAMGELDERILWHAEVTAGLGPEVVAQVRFTELEAGATTFFQIAPLVGHLRTIVGRSRPLRPTDLRPPTEASGDEDAASVFVDLARVQAVHDAMTDRRTDAVDLANDLGSLLVDLPARRDDLLDGVDTFFGRTVATLGSAATFGLPGTSWADLLERRRSLAADLRTAAEAVVGRWAVRLDEADRQLAIDDALPSTATDEERIRVLALAERELRAAVSDPLPEDAAAYRTALEAQHEAFTSRLTALANVASSGVALHQLLADLAVLLPTSDLDSDPLDVAPFQDQTIDLCRTLLGRVGAIIGELETRLAAGASHLAQHAGAPPGQPRVTILQAAARALLGDDVVLVPEFALSDALADEWSAATAWSRNGDLMAHLGDRDFPVDDWLHGVARVREKVHAFEQARLLTFAAGRPEPSLTPVQFPHASEPWLALELPDGFAPSGERLVYTAHQPIAFDKSSRQAGLLIDEWTEVLPSGSLTTGLTFHYDSPDTEPPQAMLLVVPPDPREPWRWDQLVSTLHDTLDLARVRAIEPDQVADTRYAAYLPATVTAATVRGLSIAANFALNNALLELIRVNDA